TSPDHRSTVSTPGGVRTGTRVAVDARESRMLLQREESWLAGLAPWVAEPGEHSTLLRQALLDIYVLSDRLPAPVAGWTPRWRYVWPRDVAHVAVALAAVGDPDRALDALAFFRTVPRRAGCSRRATCSAGAGHRTSGHRSSTGSAGSCGHSAASMPTAPRRSGNGSSTTSAPSLRTWPGPSASRSTPTTACRRPRPTTGSTRRAR